MLTSAMYAFIVGTSKYSLRCRCTKSRVCRQPGRPPHLSSCRSSTSVSKFLRRFRLDCIEASLSNCTTDGTTRLIAWSRFSEGGMQAL
jgi:hypothetical protein